MSFLRHPHPGVGGAKLRRLAQSAAFKGGPDWHARFPGLRTTSTRRTIPKTHRAAVDLRSLLDRSNAGELIPDKARYNLQQLIELEIAAVLGADRHERTEERLGYRNGSRSLIAQVSDIALQIH